MASPGAREAAAHEAAPNGRAAAPGTGPVTGSESNGSHAGAGRIGADGAAGAGTGTDGPGTQVGRPGSPGAPGSGPGGPGGSGGGAGRSGLKNWRVRSRLLLLIAIVVWRNHQSPSGNSASLPATAEIASAKPGIASLEHVMQGLLFRFASVSISLETNHRTGCVPGVARRRS